jgi:NADH-quinone oxidoreductase subunit L
MMSEIYTSLAGLVCFSPLIGALIAGFFAKRIGAFGAQFMTILCVAIAFASALVLFNYMYIEETRVFNYSLYTWIAMPGITFEVGFWLDRLSVGMMLVVTAVSLLVHIYSMGYMKGDPGIQRFFAYVSFFTFAMLMLVGGNNLLQVFFGWEGVGVASYLLIGFWFHKDSAANGAFKAFVVNRVGDFGFLLAMGLFVTYVGSLNFSDIFHRIPDLAAVNLGGMPLIDWICMLLFIGAMGKSAQMPLHIWLPESMEGPTPISALIHAATMVTAGVYLLVRLSPLFEFSPMIRSWILVIGATGGLILGMIAIVNHDIKRVVAYSTLSQLGYMMAAVGASAYGLAMFHLITHAFFKALLFLAAGAVIVAAHHEQDMRKFGGLIHSIPLVGVVFAIGSMSLMAVPLFSGFYSKDAIIAAIGATSLPGAHYAYYCLLMGVMVTSIYSVRAFYLTFLGQPRSNIHIHELSNTIKWPLIILAIPSMGLGYVLAPMAGNLHWFGEAIFYTHQSVTDLAGINGHLNHPGSMAMDAINSAPFILMLLSSFATFWIYRYSWAEKISKIFAPIQCLLENKWYFDWLVEQLLVPFVWIFSRAFNRVGDQLLIDQLMVMGPAKLLESFSLRIKAHISGHLYHYAILMLLGTAVLISKVVMI